MISIRVESEFTYEVHVGGEWRAFLSSIRQRYKKILIIAPPFIVENAALQSLCSTEGYALFAVPDGEAQKSYSTIERVWDLLGNLEFGRTDAIVAIGGGATSDLAGFAAATWLRGIAWYAIPTTLAGMVDAALGGKTGINTERGKNLVGSFYSPRAVCADTTWLTTLSDRDFSAGLAEVIKCGYIRDISILDLLDRAAGVSAARGVALELVAKSVAVKAQVVSADFKEGKLREILNFGHTLGHAIEKSAQYSLRHGEAVSIGLHFAATLSESELGFKASETQRLQEILQKFNLPTTVAPGVYQFSELLALMSGDKKSRDGRIRFIGLSAAGCPDWIESASNELLATTYEKITR